MAEWRRQGIGQQNDGPGRAVVLLEDDDLCAGERARELGQQPRIGATEPVDALERVAHNCQVLMPCGKSLQQGCLQLTTVLVLVPSSQRYASWSMRSACSFASSRRRKGGRRPHACPRRDR